MGFFDKISKMVEGSHGEIKEAKLSDSSESAEVPSSGVSNILAKGSSAILSSSRKFTAFVLKNFSPEINKELICKEENIEKIGKALDDGVTNLDSWDYYYICSNNALTAEIGKASAKEYLVDLKDILSETEHELFEAKKNNEESATIEMLDAQLKEVEKIYHEYASSLEFRMIKSAAMLKNSDVKEEDVLACLELNNDEFQKMSHVVLCPYLVGLESGISSLEKISIAKAGLYNKPFSNRLLRVIEENSNDVDDIYLQLKEIADHPILEIRC